VTKYVFAANPKLCTKCANMEPNVGSPSSPRCKMFTNVVGTLLAFCDDARNSEELCGFDGRHFLSVDEVSESGDSNKSL